MLYLKEPIEREKLYYSIVETSPRCVVKEHPEGFSSCLFAELISRIHGGEGLPSHVTFDSCNYHNVYINLALFSNCEYGNNFSSKYVALPKEIREKVLESYKDVIGQRVFKASDIPDKETVTAFMIPEGYDAIEEGAFKDCPNLQRVLLPKGMKQIGNNAFSFCPNLKEVEMPKTVEYIGGEAFSGCSQLDTIKITKCKGKEVDGEIHLPEKFKFLGVGAFADCKNLTSIEIPKQVTDILADTFNGCTNLKDVKLPEGLQNIEDLAFMQCSKLKNIKIPNTVKRMGHFCFAGCEELEDIQLSTQCETLPKNCFDGCKNLKKIEIPKCVKTIEERCFVDVNPLLEILIQEGDAKDINISPDALPESPVIKELKPREIPIVAVGGNVYETIEKPKEKPFAGLRRLLARHREKGERG